MAHDVFISHSSRDKPTADAVCALLESDGLRCWIAPRDVQAGVSYAGAIIEAVNECRAMVLIFSDAANDSPQIEREIERAANRRIPILPFRIQNVTPERGLEYFLSTPHWLDAFTPPLETHIRELARQLHALLDPRPAAAPVAVLPVPTPAAAQPAAPPLAKAAPGAAAAKSRMRTGALVAIGAAVVGTLAVAGGATMWLQGQKAGPAASPSSVAVASSAVASSQMTSSASAGPPASNASAAASAAAASAAAREVANLPPPGPVTARGTRVGAAVGRPRAVGPGVAAIRPPPVMLRRPPLFRPTPFRPPPFRRPPPRRPPLRRPPLRPMRRGPV
jgi:hypothetical protein